jgi:hypothetical protein
MARPCTALQYFLNFYEKYSDIIKSLNFISGYSADVCSTNVRFLMPTKCVFCGSTAYGPNCPKSTSGLHQHNNDEKRCIYCGSSSYGNGCLQTPTRKHIHGHGGNKCIYCGSTDTGMGCKHSPHGKHEK